MFFFYTLDAYNPQEDAYLNLLRMTEYIEYLRIFQFSSYFCFQEKRSERKCKFINLMQFPIIGEFRNNIFIHIGCLFIPLRMTEYLRVFVSLGIFLPRAKA